jgi:hypothetical protein
MILVLNDSVVDDIDVSVLKVLGVYAVCGVKSLMSSIISSTSFVFAALAAAFSMINYFCKSIMSLSYHYLLNMILNFEVLKIWSYLFQFFLNLKIYLKGVIAHDLLITVV